MKRATALSALRYMDARREYERVAQLPIGDVATKAARGNLEEAREGLASDLSVESDEIAVQVLYTVALDPITERRRWTRG